MCPRRGAPGSQRSTAGLPDAAPLTLLPRPEQSVPVGGAKKSGWGDMDTGDSESAPAPVPRRRRAAEAEEEPTETKIAHNPKHDDDDDDDGGLMMIPDLDDEQAEDITRQALHQSPNPSSRQALATTADRLASPRVRARATGGGASEAQELACADDQGARPGY